MQLLLDFIAALDWSPTPQGDDWLVTVMPPVVKSEDVYNGIVIQDKASTEALLTYDLLLDERDIWQNIVTSALNHRSASPCWAAGLCRCF